MLLLIYNSRYAAYPNGEGVAWKAIGQKWLVGSNPMRCAKWCVTLIGKRLISNVSVGVKADEGSSPSHIVI